MGSYFDEIVAVKILEIWPKMWDLIIKEVMPETTIHTPSSPQKESWEILKLAEETELLKVDRILRAEEAKQKAAEARRDLAKAEEAEYYAAAARIQRDQAVRQEAALLAGDHYVREYLFNEPVSAKTVDYCLSQLALWHRLDERENDFKPMRITINSPGGDVFHGMHLFDQIHAYSLRGGGSHEVTIAVRGYAASMAGILLQAADHRVMGAQSWIMIHEISTGAIGKLTEIKDEVAFCEMVTAKIKKVFLERAAEVNGEVTEAEFDKGWERGHDWWTSAEDAVRLGFADAIG